MKQHIVPPEIRFEHPDPNPIEAPVRPGPAPNTLAKLLAQNRQLAAQALAMQEIDETFEESDDFDVDDFNGALDYAKTKWEVAADAALLTPHELFERVYGAPQAELIKQAAMANGASGAPKPGDPPGNNSGVAP